ncbi:MAG: phytanoyl-CoA dioxygenase family protein [Proteobacteria bacterium]|nr:phytanoyl-CoA dioxygenase family protein [Pseudomonadota bacterium]MDA1300414.1 phytanoyl-CoA dioxygenase family protein [Pseudomonadota bacterium]
MDDVVQAFEKDGYCLIEGFFTPEEVAGADAHVDHWLQRWDELKGESTEYRQRFGVHLKALPIAREPEFTALFDHPKMVEITKAILGEDFEPVTGFAFATPRDGGQGWHKDSCDPEPGRFTLNRLVYSRDYRPEQGQLYVLPGSHRYYGFEEDGPNDEDLPGQVVIQPRAGMLVLVSSHCAHRVGINQTDDIRVVLNSRVNRRGVPTDLCDLCTFRSGRWRHSTQTFLGK